MAIHTMVVMHGFSGQIISLKVKDIQFELTLNLFRWGGFNYIPKEIIYEPYKSFNIKRYTLYSRNFPSWL